MAEKKPGRATEGEAEPTPPTVQEFPKMLYNQRDRNAPPITVASKAEQEAAGKEWGETPLAPKAPKDDDDAA
jgi:hypothetical protein